jgi:dipeptidyl aminopeptidase/acylaminoacyl peptidase
VKRELERVEIPDEHEARVRAWQLVEAAFAERVQSPRRTWPRARVAVALAVVAAIVAAVASPPGRSVVTTIREKIGVESAEPSLFSLPAPGRVLVSSPGGSWVVEADGSKRRLGPYTNAAWSPFGRFVVATRRNELAALEPDGDIRWTLARPQLGPFAWGGTQNDTRIAYATGRRLHVVGGDGRGDQLLFSAPDVPEAPIAWARGSRRVLAHATQGILRVLDAGARGEEMWSATVPQPRFLAWTDDRARLVSLSRDILVVFDRNGRRLFRHELAGRATAMSVRPNGHEVAIALRLRGSTRSELYVFSLDRRDAPQRRLFGGTGTFSAVAWSPDTRWLLVAWNEADQWVFLRTRGAPRIAAAANVAEQFDGVFPEVEGWCCAR